MSVAAVNRVGPITVNMYLNLEGERTAVTTMESQHLMLRPMIPESLRGRASAILPKAIWEAYAAGVSDIDVLAELFASEENCQAYGTTKPRPRDAVERIIAMDSGRTFEKGNPWTGYAVCDRKIGVILGRGAIGTGYSPKDDVPGSYQAAPLDKEGGAGPAEVQMGDFVAHPTIPREALYRELILTLLTAADRFLSLGIRQNGQTVKRITVTVISSDENYFVGDTQRELEMRKRCLEAIFGPPLGVLGEEDSRNYSKHVRLVYGCEAADVRARLAPHGICIIEIPTVVAE